MSSRPSLGGRALRAAAVITVTFLTTVTALFAATVPASAAVPAPSAAMVVRGVRAVTLAAAERGKPYRWGAAGPNAFDCSGLVMFVYRHLGMSLPHIAELQYLESWHIAARSAIPGDLVFFHSGSYEIHVGIYAGHGLMWDAPYAGQRVSLERIWSSTAWYGRVR